MEHSPGQTTSWVTNQTLVNLRKLKLSNIFSDHDAVRLDINYKKKTVRNTNTWRLNNTFQQVIEEIKMEIKTFLETNDNKNDNSKPMRCSKSSSKREFLQQYNPTLRKTLNRQPNFTPKTTGERRRRTTTKNPKLVE